MRLKGRPRLFFKPPAKDLGDQEGRAVHAYRNEHTIASTYQLTGRGYWSGRTVNVVCQPAKTGTGIRFQRVDLAEKPICPACTDHTDAIAYRTNLGLGEARFEMVEHLMAALRGLEIDNCLIQTDAPELPGLDGSAEAWTESLQAAGLVIQPASARRFRIEHPIRVTSGRGVLTAQPTDGDIGTYEYQLDYGDEATIRPQSFSVSLTPNRFVRHVSSARTFVTW
ncbi:MAG: UDP-3-O-acyl-N-acetylglucosamine deacetylase, partial [Planctomycetota bacterium]